MSPARAVPDEGPAEHIRNAMQVLVLAERRAQALNASQVTLDWMELLSVQRRLRLALSTMKGGAP